MASTQVKPLAAEDDCEPEEPKGQLGHGKDKELVALGLVIDIAHLIGVEKRRDSEVSRHRTGQGPKGSG